MLTKGPRHSISILMAILFASTLLIPGNSSIQNVRAAPTPMTCAQYNFPSAGTFTDRLCTNFPVNVRNESITQAIIAVYPGDNTAWPIPDAADAVGKSQEVLILAPMFSESSFSDTNILYWDVFWRFGDYAKNAPVSSFSITDDLIDIAANREIFPNLTKIVVTGFSAGGQYANRYAATNTKQQEITNKTGGAIQFRYVVGAPSIYVYMDDERWDSSSGTFKPPTTCLGYNDYPFGLDYLSGWPYVDNVTADQVRSQYKYRSVYYIVGVLDNNPNDSSLQRGCQADLQGLTRLERTRWYYAHIQDFYGSQATSHIKVEVPDLGHTTAVYNTAEGRPTLFDNWPIVYGISGRVLNSRGAPVSGVTISLSSGITTTTDANGNYTLSGVPAASYTITPSLGGLKFSPASRAVSTPPSSTGQNFTLQLNLSAAPAAGKPGSYFAVSGEGFPSSATLNVRVNGSLIGAVTSSASGAVSFQLQTGNTAKAGQYQVSLETLAPISTWIRLDASASLIPSGAGQTLVIPPETNPFLWVFLPTLVK